MSRTRQGFVRSRSGFTLIEMLVVVVLLGLVALIGFPKISAALVQNDIRSARTTVINMVAAARAASVQTNRSMWIKFEGGKAYVVTSGSADPVGGIQNLGTQYGVTMSGADSIQFDPRGFGADLGGGISIVLSRGGHSDTVTIDGLGRVTK